MFGKRKEGVVARIEAFSVPGDEAGVKRTYITYTDGFVAEGPQVRTIPREFAFQRPVDRGA